MTFNQTIYKTSLLLLFIYAVCRALFVTPLFDEAATFVNYIVSGNGWNPDIYADANNHLLISIFGNFCLEFGLDHPIFMRLPSLIGFLLYGFALHQLFVNQLKVPFAKLIVVCTYAIPWILEYGALARGYGFAIGCYFMMIVVLIEIIKQSSVKLFLLFFALAWLTILSSFTFTVPVFLLLGISFVYILSTFKQQTKKRLILYFAIGCIFLVAYYPLFTRALVLKENGSLWWGSSVGLWEVTGQSISKIVLFSTHWMVRILLNIITITSFILWVRRLVQTNPKIWFKNPFLWIIAYTYGLLLSLIVLAKIFDMNYPMDRVGMYLVPLYIILFIFICKEIRILKWGILLLLFFPFTLFQNVSFKYTIFSPEDILTEETFKKLEEISKEGNQIAAEWMLYINHQYRSRFTDHKNIIPLANTKNQSDYFINYASNPKDTIEDYELVFLEQKTLVGIYKKKHLKPKKVVKTIEVNPIEFNDEAYFFYNSDSTINEWLNKPFAIKLDGEFEMTEPVKTLKIHANATNELGEIVALYHTNLHSTYYPKKELAFTAYTLTFPAQKLSDIKIRIENPLQKKIKIKSLKIHLLNEDY